MEGFTEPCDLGLERAVKVTPGIFYGYRGDAGASGAPYEDEGIVGYSLSGSTQIYSGDLLALSTFSGVSISSQPSIRKLLAADKTALYGGVSVVAAPGAVTVSAVTATSYGVPFLANGAYNALATWVSATGETVAGTATGTATTAGGTQALWCVPPASVPAGAVGWKCYVSAVGTTTPFFLQSGILGVDQGFAVGGLGTSNALLVTGANPPTVNTSGKVAGILGVAPYAIATNSAGAASATATPGYGGATLQFSSMGAGIPTDFVTGSSLYQFYPAVGQNVFAARLDTTSANATPLLNDTLAGFILTAGSGNTANQTIYTIDTNAASGAQCIRILRCEADDPYYNKATGLVYFQFMAAFSQALTAVAYSAQ